MRKFKENKSPKEALDVGLRKLPRVAFTFLKCIVMP